MQLAELGLIVSTLRLCVAYHVHAQVHVHLPRQEHPRGCALSLDIGYTTKAVSTRTIISVLFLEADVDF